MADVNGYPPPSADCPLRARSAAPPAADRGSELRATEVICRTAVRAESCTCMRTYSVRATAPNRLLIESPASMSTNFADLLYKRECRHCHLTESDVADWKVVSSIIAIRHYGMTVELFAP